MTDRELFNTTHLAGGVLFNPTNTHRLALAFGEIDLPLAVDNRNYCTPVEDQGTRPWCAAYTAAAFAENVMWRRDGFIQEVEVQPLYEWAKKNDYAPAEDGTTLDAVCEALKAKGVFGENTSTRLIYGEAQMKQAVHRYGCALGAFNITSEWYNLAGGRVENITGAKDCDRLGGHAVLVVGYNAGGVWVENSWGTGWGTAGFGFLEWQAFHEQFLYGAVLTRCLDGFK